MQGTKWIIRLVALFLVVALAIPAMAKPFSKNLNLPAQTKFGSTVLKAGNYALLIDDTTVTIKQGSRVIAQIEGQWEPSDTKHQRTSIVQGPDGQVSEIRFAGEKRTLMIRQ